MNILKEALSELRNQEDKILREDKKVIEEGTLARFNDETKKLANKLIDLANKDNRKITFEDACEVIDQSFNDKVDNIEDFYKRLNFDEEDEEELDEDFDEEGLQEILSFNLSDFNESCEKEDCSEGECEAEPKEELDEAFHLDEIKKDARFANLSTKVINLLTRLYKKDLMGDDKATDEGFIAWVDDACNGGTLTPLALEFADDMSIEDFINIVDGDKEFEDAVLKLARSWNWIDKNGNYVASGLEDDTKAEKANLRGLIREMRSFDDSISELSKIYYKKNESLTEDLASTLPVHALGEQEVIDYINNIPVAKGIQKDENGVVIAKARPTCFFKLGYFKEVQVAAKYRGGRGSTEEDPKVRVFKAVEYNKLYTGADYENLKGVKQFRKETGTERSGEKTGFSYQGDGTTVNKIGTYANGDKALQAYLANNCRTRSKYFISINDGDVTEASREEVSQYLTPGDANKLLNPQPVPKTKEVSVNMESGEELVTFNPQAVNRLKISNIYMIGSLGHSIM